MAKFWLEDDKLKSDSSILNKIYHFQIGEIRKGLENGLTSEQVSIYANPEFDYNQMREIRKGLESGLTIEQVSLYTKPEFNDYQMFQIRFGLENGLTSEQVSIYANPKFEGRYMNSIRIGLEHGLTSEQIFVFNTYEMQEISKGLEQGLTPEQISIYAKPEFDYHQMCEIRKGLEAGIDIEKVKMYANPLIDSYKMNLYRKCFATGLDVSINEEFREIKNRKELFKEIEDNICAYLGGYDDEDINPYDIQITLSDIYYCGEHWMTMDEFKKVYLEELELGVTYPGLDFQELENHQTLESDNTEDHDLVE